MDNVPLLSKLLLKKKVFSTGINLVSFCVLVGASKSKASVLHYRNSLHLHSSALEPQSPGCFYDPALRFIFSRGYYVHHGELRLDRLSSLFDGHPVVDTKLDSSKIPQRLFYYFVISF